MKYYKEMWRRYAEFSGRSTRAEYWYVYLINIIIFFVLDVISRIGVFFAVGSFLYALAVIVPTFALTVRRLHDIGKSGKLLLATIIPFALTFIFYITGIVNLTTVFYRNILNGDMFNSPFSGTSGALFILGIICALIMIIAGIYLLVQLAKQGVPGPNQYGPDPRGGTSAESSWVPHIPVAYTATPPAAQPAPPEISGQYSLPAVQPQETAHPNPNNTASWTCPKCGWVNSAGQSDCIGCNMSITIPEELARKVADNKPEPQAITETTDNSKVASKIYIRKTVKKPVVGIKRCPKCKELTASKFCPNCGTRIVK